jgi:hypothetical protein
MSQGYRFNIGHLNFPSTVVRQIQRLAHVMAGEIIALEFTFNYNRMARALRGTQLKNLTVI